MNTTQPSNTRSFTAKEYYDNLKKIIENLELKNKDTEWVIKICFLSGTKTKDILMIKLKDLNMECQTIRIGQRNVIIPRVFSDFLNYIKDKGILNNELVFYTQCKNIESAYRIHRYHINKSELDPEGKKIVQREYNFRKAIIEEPTLLYTVAGDVNGKR